MIRLSLYAFTSWYMIWYKENYLGYLLHVYHIQFSLLLFKLHCFSIFIALYFTSFLGSIQITLISLIVFRL